MQLDILGVSYTLTLTPNLILPDEGPESLGVVDNHKCTIHVCDNTPSQRLYILLHELLHVMTYMGHLQFLRVEGQQYDDEAKVDAVASLMAEVLKRNPHVFVPLIGGQRERKAVMMYATPTFEGVPYYPQEGDQT